MPGLLITWNRLPGDRVKRGHLAAEVETDKGLTVHGTGHGGAITREDIEHAAARGEAINAVRPIDQAIGRTDRRRVRLDQSTEPT